MKVERVLPVQPFVSNKQYDWRQGTPEKPDDLWVGKTIFYLKCASRSDLLIKSSSTTHVGQKL